MTERSKATQREKPDAAGADSTATKDIVDKMHAKSLARKREALVAMHEEGQLTLWPDNQRGIPNELVRCALFSAKNQKEPRLVHSPKAPMRIPIIGGGEVVFIGEEVRQDDESVWIQLFHLAKQARSDTVSFTPNSFITELGWPRNGQSYERLLTSIRRLASCGLEIYSSRFDKGISVKLLAKYQYSKASGKPWHVQVFNKDEQFIHMFDKLYTRFDWDLRKLLPVGISTWLHSFFSSHREPFDHSMSTLIVGAGLILERPEDALLDEVERKKVVRKRFNNACNTIKDGLQNLVDEGFLADFHINKKKTVRVRRIGDARPIV